MIPIILVIIPLLISIAFLTLGERKIMGSMQRRIGPNKVGVYGLLQPFADALKLFIKETILVSQANKILFILAPIISLVFSILGWVVIPYEYGVTLSDMNIGILYLLGISSLGVLGIILAGWAANSKYALLGSLRTTAQMISYEVSLGLIILTVILLTSSLNINIIIKSQSTMLHIIPLLPIGLLFFLSALAETNRAPFDLPEAESELVSGFSTEHSSLSFAYFFLSEYGSIILISSLTLILFFGGLSPIGLCLILIIFIWIRASFPRLRFDQLMSMCWINILPLSLSFFIFIASVLISFNSLLMYWI
jgi:NADH-ubiquinone oxidoreductase chain 1